MLLEDERIPVIIRKTGRAQQMSRVVDQHFEASKVNVGREQLHM